ncbi:protein-L-isoaspartate O-methyltransferase family protein [Thiohalobacter sp.]|uniref:protein-L-isoaspartate O-methyltransferase family protein n=1 Tax=Thiohalobacter sp. TaxID=2025948 RepID=UPI00261AFF43|nr:protein-L-isoaspartate O-methyltransferase [Thiohalobacter sp.]
MAQTATAFDFEKARFNMIEQQIRPWEVLDQRVLDVIAATPREDFVPARYRNSLAFADIALPIGHDQVMMPPKLEGRLLQSLTLAPTDRVLEIGTGSGYLTACLAHLAGEVHSVDLYEDFTAGAGERLAAHGIRNVALQTADAALGWNEDRGFDAIAVTGSLPLLHKGFHKALKIGGRLFVIVGHPPVMEALRITRVGDNQWATESLFDTAIPPLVGAPDREAFDL